MKITSIGYSPVNQSNQNYKNKQQNSPNFKCGIIGTAKKINETNELFEFMCQLGEALQKEGSRGYNVSCTKSPILSLGNSPKIRQLLPYLMEVLKDNSVLKAHGATFKIYSKKQ